jgi:hypothetical protein
VVDPDLHPRLLVLVGGVQAGCGRRLVEVFADDVGFVERLAGAIFLWAAQGGDETAWVESQEGFLFMIWVDFDILVGDLLFFQHQPRPLDEA